MLALIVIILVDISVVKVNDLVDKNFIPLQSKLILFSVESFLCLLLQFITVRYIQTSLGQLRVQITFRDRVLPLVSLVSLCVLGFLIGFLIFQQFYNEYYDTAVIMSIVIASYGVSAFFMILLSLLFLSWYRSSRNRIVFLYFVAMSVVAFNLIITASFAFAKIGDRPDRVGEYIGSSGDISGGSHSVLDTIYRTTSFIAFFGIWITTAILMNSYRERRIINIFVWIILAAPLIYFSITYSYQFIFGKLVSSYMQIDPITVSIVLSAFLSLSKPIGGLLFGMAFWNMSKMVAYERQVKMYMVISGWGIFLLFAANQAPTQIVSPYPPFGLATITVLILGGYMMFLGIYNSATQVSTNNELRKFVRKHAQKSNLLDLIGQAEMENAIQRMVRDLIQNSEKVEVDRPSAIELDEKELRKYIDYVLKEVKQEKGNP
jgi:hypothetical protein